MLKGRMAESLVEELLKKCGNKVYRFGYEAVLQNLTQLENGFSRNDEVGQRISSIPDFVIVNKQGVPLLIEVKFRKNLKVYPKEIKRLNLIRKFWDAKIILLTIEKPYFRISTTPYLKNEKEWVWRPLEQDQDLNITTDSLVTFDEIVEKYCFKKESTHVLKDEKNETEKSQNEEKI